MADDNLPYALPDQEFEDVTGYTKQEVANGQLIKKKPGAIKYDPATGKDTGERYSPDSKSIQILRDLAAGFMQIGAAPSALYGLAGAGVDTLTGDKSFAENLLTSDGLKAMQDYDQRILQKSKELGMSDEEAVAHLQNIKAHGELNPDTGEYSHWYQDELNKHLRTGISAAARINAGINDIVGENRLPSEMTAEDSAYQIAGGLVPIPGSLVGKIAATGAGNAVARGIARVSANRAGRIALDVAEGATPVVINSPNATAGQQVGRWATNFGIQEGIDQTQRQITGQPNALDWFYHDDGSVDAGHVLETGAAAVGTAILAYKMKYGKAVDGLVNEGMSAADRLAENSPNPASTTRMGVSKFLGDEFSPAQTYAKSIGINDADADLVRTTYELNAGHQPEAMVLNWFERGQRPDMSQGVGGKEMLRAIDDLEKQQPGFREGFAKYVAARNRLLDEERAVTEHAIEERKTQSEFLAAARQPPTNKTMQRMAELQQKLSDLAAEKAARANDTDAGLRPSLEKMTTADAKSIVQSMPQLFPGIPSIDRVLRNEYKAYVNIAEKEGMFSKDRAKQLRIWIDKGLTHFEDNPLAGKSWLDQKKAGIGKFINDWADPQGIGGIETFRGLQDRNPRKGYLNAKDERVFVNSGGLRPEPRPNAPLDPIQQLAIQVQRQTKAIASNRAKDQFLKIAENAPGNVNGKYVKQVASYTDAQTQSTLHSTTIDSQLNNRKIAHVGVWRGNGEFQVYRLSGPQAFLTKQALTFAPVATVPIANGIRKFSQSFLTGALRPSFALKAVTWDVFTTAAFRDIDKMAFGPVSGLAFKLFQPGGRAFKTFSNIGGLVDPWIMLAKAPVVGLQNGAIAAYGRTELRRRIEATGNRMLQQLTTGSSTFAGLTQLPGGQRLVNKVAMAMAKGYENSWYGMMEKYGIAHSTNFVSLSDELLNSSAKLGYSTAKSGTVRHLWDIYTASLSAVHDTSKTMFFSQNYKRLRSAWNGAIPKEEMDAMLNAVRKSSGDFQRHHSTQTVNALMSTVRYGNVIYQTQRMIAKSIQRDPLGTFTRIGLGIILPKLMWDHYTTNHSQEARDYYWSQPNDKRMSTWFMPRPDVFIREQLGEKIPFSTANWIEMPLPPEALPFLVPVQHGLLAMGWLSPDTYKGAPVPMDIGRDMGAALDASFGVTSPAFLGELFAASGNQIQPGAAMFRGQPLVRPSIDPSLQGANFDKMSPGSGMSRAFYDVFVSLFGAATAAYIDGLNVGMETFDRAKQGAGKSTGEALKEGVVAGAEEAKIKNLSTVPYGSTLFPDYTRRFLYTPQGEAVGEAVTTLKNGIEKQYAVETENRPGGGGRNNRALLIEDDDMAATIAASTNIPLLSDAILDIHNTFFKKNSEFGGLTQQRALKKAEYDALMRGTAAQRDENTGVQDNSKIISPRERWTKAQQIALQINALDQARYKVYQQEWKRISDENGQTFSQMFGKPFTAENLFAAVQQNSRSATLGLPNTPVQQRLSQ